jgi:eukaryotic-like serine/threonine-protein kinase
MTPNTEGGLRRGLEIPQTLAALAAVLAAALSTCAPAPAPTPGLEVAWRAKLDGAVDGTPAVAAGTVFAGSAGGELAAFDIRTGAMAWTRRGLGPIADSPAVEGGRVYAGTLSGHVLALKADDGSTLWDWTGPPDAAIWSSPILYRGLVLVGVASPYGDEPLVPGRLVGLDARTGKERWTMCLLKGCAPGDGVWSTPAIDDRGEAFVGVGNPDDGVLAFDPLTGERKWLASLYADNQRDLDVGARPLVLMSNGREIVLQASVEGTLAALEAATGGILWSRKLVAGSAVHGLIASPAYDGLNLYVASASPPDGVFAVRPQDGAQVWRHPTNLPVYSAPAVADGAVFFGTGAVFGDLNEGSVFELSKSDGHVVGRFDTHSAVRSGPVIAAAGLVVVGDYAGDLLALRVSSS